MARRFGPQHGAFGSEDIHQDVGGVHQHFLFVGQFCAERLHRKAEHHQRHFLERGDSPVFLRQDAFVERRNGRRRQ